VDGLLLENSVELLSDAVGLRFGNEGEARGDSPTRALVEEIIGGGAWGDLLIMAVAIKAKP